ncbi:MAG: hypothetical protein ACFFCW_34980 [Candidatus Hodarchaeota archaeon]
MKKSTRLSSDIDQSLAKHKKRLQEVQNQESLKEEIDDLKYFVNHILGRIATIEAHFVNIQERVECLEEEK